MADATADAPAEAPAKKGGKGMLIGIVLALVLGGGGFFATYSGLLALPFGGDGHAKEEEKVHVEPLPPVAFVPVERITIPLGRDARAANAVFAGAIEVNPETKADVELLMPRVLDVINGYLRAVETRDLEDPAAMTRMRAQLLRRIQMVTGEGRVRDLLITEFVLN